MASKLIKGLTVEIGGDTTKLGKALENVNKKSQDLSTELGDINRLLKFDPGNADLLAQKQKVLAAAVENTKEKLDTLKKAEQQVQKQFERGEVSEEQVRALKREIVATEKKMDSYERAIKETNDALKGHAESSEKAEKSASNLGGTLANVAKAGFAAVTAVATAAVGGLTAAAESTREYRTEMGKLDTAFTTAGHSSSAALETYQALQGVLGETEQAVEAANHLAQLANNEEDLAKWTTIATGVYATFGSSLPVENITEAANETAKTGKIVGGLSDALNWAGVSEEKFQAQLDACTTEQERQALITETLNGLYSEAAAAYRETNAEIIRANEANEAWTATLAEAGAAVEPILTDVKMLGVSLLQDFMPSITGLTEAFRGLINGADGAADELGAALSNIVTQLLNKVVELAPTVVQVAASLIGTLVNSLLDMLPQLLDVVVNIIIQVIDLLAEMLPQIVQKIVEVVPQLIEQLVAALPLLLDAIVSLVLAIVDALPGIITTLIEAIPGIIQAVVDAIIAAIPMLLDASIQLFMAIVQAIPVIIQAIVENLPTIINTIIDGLLDALPLLLEAAVQLLMAIVEAIPTIISALVKELPKIVTTIVQTLLSRLPDLIAGAVQLLMGIIKAIPTIQKELVKQMPTIIKSIVSGLLSGVKDLVKVGGDLLGGLLKGMLDPDAIWKAVKSIFGSVMDAFTSLFDIHSPSRVIRDQIGAQLSAGLAEGITANADAPLAAMSDLTDDLLGESELNGLTLDRRLESTFGGGNAASAANAGLLSKLDSILAAIERGQVLMIDKDTLVGSTVTSYDNKLGQRRVLAARGAL